MPSVPREHSKKWPHRVFRTEGLSPWDYLALDRVQRKTQSDILGGVSRGEFLFSELSPVVTLGRKLTLDSFAAQAQAIMKQGVAVIETDRGGNETYHGPGQWVLFPVARLVDLTGSTTGVRIVVRKLLDIAVTAAASLGVATQCRDGQELGVWTERGKLASVGIAIKSGVVLHGLSFNIYPTSLSFAGINPCGISNARPAFVAEHLTTPVRDHELLMRRGLEALQAAADRVFS